MHEDVAIRQALMKQLKQAAVSKIVIERRTGSAASPSTRAVRVW